MEPRGLLRAFGVIALASAIGCRDKARVDADAAVVVKADPIATPDAAPEVERGPDVDDAIAQLLELEEAGIDGGAATDAVVGAIKITPAKAMFRSSSPDATLRQQRFRFRACARLLGDAGSARVLLTIKVGEGGEVVAATCSDKTALGECAAKAAKAITFDEPDGVATLEVPIEFVRR